MTDFTENFIYNPYYLLDSGEIYNKDTAKFVDIQNDAEYKQFLANGNKPLDLNGQGYTKEQLINTVLKFYGWEVGECLLTLEELKNVKLEELKKITQKFEENVNKDMGFKSSLGFKSDGDRRTRFNLEDLIKYFDSMAVEGVVDYRDYDNNTQKLNKEQLNTLLTEQVLNGNNLYNQKRQKESEIMVADNIDKIKAIDLSFEMLDFQKINSRFKL